VGVVFDFWYWYWFWWLVCIDFCGSPWLGGDFIVVFCMSEMYEFYFGCSAYIKHLLLINFTVKKTVQIKTKYFDFFLYLR
jgi:hypothetical protein